MKRLQYEPRDLKLVFWRSKWVTLCAATCIVLCWIWFARWRAEPQIEIHDLEVEDQESEQELWTDSNSTTASETSSLDLPQPPEQGRAGVEAPVARFEIFVHASVGRKPLQGAYAVPLNGNSGLGSSEPSVADGRLTIQPEFDAYGFASYLVSCEDYTPVSLIVEPSSTRYECELAPSNSLRVLVVDGSGEPIDCTPSLHVEVANWRRVPWRAGVARDGDYYVFRGIPPGLVTLECAHKQLFGTRNDVVVPPSGDITTTVRLVAGIPVEVSIVADRRPVRGARLRLVGNGYEVSAMSDGNGRAILHARPDRGHVRVFAEFERYELQSRLINPEDQPAVRFNLSSGGILTVKVDGLEFISRKESISLVLNVPFGHGGPAGFHHLMHVGETKSFAGIPTETPVTVKSVVAGVTIASEVLEFRPGHEQFLMIHVPEFKKIPISVRDSSGFGVGGRLVVSGLSDNGLAFHQNVAVRGGEAKIRLILGNYHAWFYAYDGRFAEQELVTGASGIELSLPPGREIRFECKDDMSDEPVGNLRLVALGNHQGDGWTRQSRIGPDGVGKIQDVRGLEARLILISEHTGVMFDRRVTLREDDIMVRVATEVLWGQVVAKLDGRGLPATLGIARLGDPYAAGAAAKYQSYVTTSVDGRFECTATPGARYSIRVVGENQSWTVQVPSDVPCLLEWEGK